MMKKVLSILLVLMLIPMCTFAEEWTCPNCGTSGLTGNFCSHCAAPKPVDKWTCPNCGTSGLTGNFCSHCATPRPEENLTTTAQAASTDHTAITIPAVNNGTNRESVDITGFKVITDSVTFSGQTNIYTFTAVRDGKYAFEFNDVSPDGDIWVVIENRQDRTVLGSTTLHSSSGARRTADLTEGETYTLTIGPCYTMRDYTFTLYEPSPVIELVESVTDSMEYMWQTHTYTYTAAQSGTYTATLSNCDAGCKIDVSVEDTRGHVVREREITENWDLTMDLEAGTDYIITLQQSDGYGVYTFDLTSNTDQQPTAPAEQPTAPAEQPAAPAEQPAAQVQIITNTSSNKLFKMLDTLGRCTNKEQILGYMSGGVYKENNIGIGNDLRTKLLNTTCMGYELLQCSVTYTKAGDAISMEILELDDDVESDIQTMVADGSLAETSSGYVIAPADGAYTVKITKNYEVVMMERSYYYAFTITY